MTFGIGDDVSAVVVEVGTHTTKAGLAGEDCPQAVFPSLVGTVEANSQQYIGDSQIYHWRENMEIRTPFQDGEVVDWDMYVSLWEHAMTEKLRISPTEHPVLLVEPGWNPRENREKMLELAFEKFNIPAFYLGRGPTLAAYASGRASALVIDCGAHATSVTPVLEGFVIKKGIQRNGLGGNALTEFALERLKEIRVEVVPTYSVAKKTPVDAGVKSVFTKRQLSAITPSFDKMSIIKAVEDFKESVCQLSDYDYNESTLSMRPGKPYEFPDGFNNSFGVDRFKIPEILFNPQLAGNRYLDRPSVTAMIQSSIAACDVDSRVTFLGNVLVTGGSSLLPGFVERLFNIFAQPGNQLKCKIHASGFPVERRFGSWIGGSIIASLGSFHQMWVSKEEYDERGSSVEKRLP